MRNLPGLIFIFAGIIFSADAENLYHGDTSAETQADTLTRGNYSTDLVPFFLDDTTAFDGKKSIRIEWDRKMRSITTYRNIWYDKWISIVSTPDLKAGETYTFSFYAKASRNNYPIGVNMQPSAGWNFYQTGGNYSKNFQLSTEWERYSLSFVPKMKDGAFLRGYTAILDFSRSPEGKVWYDAVQIEKGDTASPYRNASPFNVGVSLNSSNWSNIYFPEDAVIAKVCVDLPSEKSVELSIRVVDYQGKLVREFKRTVKGPEEIKLPLESEILGWFKVTAALSAAGKMVSTHSANYIKIKKPVDIISGIQPFSGLINSSGGDFIGHFEILRKIGVKRVQASASWKQNNVDGIEFSQGKFDWSALELHLNYGKKFGMVNKLLVNPFSVPDWYFDKDELTNAKKMNSLLVLDSENHEHWRKFIGEIINRYGDLIDEIELGAEDNGRLGHNEYYKKLYPDKVKKNSVGNPFLVGGKPFDDLCSMVKIGAEEIRKTHPSMKIGAIRASRSNDVDDLLFVKEFFKKVGKEFNVLPLDFYFYPYLFGPEVQRRRAAPDGLITAYNDAKKVTEELGCDQPIYMSEFGWAPDIRYPDDSIYRKEQAEMMPKDFIVARVAGFYAFDWYLGFAAASIGNYSFLMQQNLKIQSVAASYSAVAQVVENVVESKWLAPDDITRIAIMKKHDGKGVAAVWSDSGYKLQLLGNTNITATDLMGNLIRPQEGQFSLGQAPIYIWHNNFGQLCDMLSKAEIEMSEFCTVRLRMISDKNGQLQFENLSNRTDLEINAEICSGDSEFKKEINIAKSSKTVCDIPLTEKNIKVNITAKGKKTVIEKTFTLDKLTPIGSGKNASALIAEASSRDDIIPPDPWVPWSGPDDLSVKVTSSWDAENLYLSFKVKDDLHFNKYPESPWGADSVQIAIDPKNEGAFYVPSANGKKVGPAYSEFCLALGADGKKQCVFSHGKNICDSNNYRITRDEKEKITTYELSLPWNALNVTPHAGMILGMSFVFFDDDTGKGQEYYIPMGGGITGEKNPSLYRKFILK